ncbi:FMN-binding negative transcriptional regulator [Seohaeicola saemankumensis]|nr:FMN-binding negative transcriptional regulator [Seohaeicola saemankumensis]MCA0870350.1 FMN-binding negative transcriptional regulator [Seohaeicola saemankumensis]
MHPNPVYHTASRAENMAFAAERAFGVLTVAVDGAPLLSHVPFVLLEDVVDLHLVRSNPIARALGQPLQAVIAVSGPDSYVSPDWYGIDDQVPTWNYVAVHLSGTLELRPQEELRDVLDRLSARFEDRLRPKLPWTADKMDAQALERMMRMIVPCRLRIEAVDGTWKLSQNKPDAVRERAAGQMRGFGIGAEVADLAGLMLGAKKAP